ncbi:23S rRNA (pseudouridine(1915)-N(3))-methyltransferase RlmH [Ureaplasma diversum]|uniref:Ribosomal RNA large subunit methyltransferase H n=1 Tax=Ureaplasma diversum NCTC 246 TaxID=1188241 RepID=A0A084EXA2_9BACT|nr:23S rRNA (pseudouridine(1915)-N(3))-methyltransferase RlmH [Ureaplasma diversum]KEZ22594.1 Hypothetical protein, putative SPOUT methyltransferase [Ureaplasma diversum NCTC 246]
MKIKIISVGKIKNKHLNCVINDYIQRINKFTKVSCIEVDDEPETAQLSVENINQIKAKEASRIIKHIEPKDYVVALVIEGKMINSVQLSEMITKLQNQAITSIAFVIGGSNGLCQSVYQRANFLLSFSPMTFAHNIAKLLLSEQIYRAFSIINNTKYHK